MRKRTSSTQILCYSLTRQPPKSPTILLLAYSRFHSTWLASYLDGGRGAMPRHANRDLRQTQRACDHCRLKKIRCDGPSQPNHQCTSCNNAGTPCTYDAQVTRKGPSKAYVQALETRLKRAETLLKELRPELDLSKELERVDLNADSEVLSTGSSDYHLPARRLAASVIAPKELFSATGYCSRHVDASNTVSTPLALNPEDKEIPSAFFGQSSPFGLMQDAMELRLRGQHWRAYFSLAHSWRRTEFWDLPSYEGLARTSIPSPPPHAQLPSPDLLHLLIDAYFAHYNTFIPLLHKELFMRQLASGLHKHHPQFLALALMVCALGSRCISDPRVLADPSKLSSAGWAYYDMVQPMTIIGFRIPRLFDLQTHALAAMFLWASSAPSAGQALVGLAIRMAQDVGAHQRIVYRDKPNLVDELWKRVFWALVVFESSYGTITGKATVMREESYNVEMPLEVDDDCWDLSDPAHNYPLKHQQPEGRPSFISYFTHTIKTESIMSFAMRTIYCLNKSKALLGYVGRRWEEKMLVELDSLIEKWFEAIPRHLRWDPNCTDILWFKQSAALHQAYHFVQIFIHRRRIQQLRLTCIRDVLQSEAEAVSQPDQSTGTTQVKKPLMHGLVRSLARCRHAGKEIINTAEVVRHRTFGQYDGQFTQNMTAVAVASLVLLLSAWTEGIALQIEDQLQRDGRTVSLLDGVSREEREQRISDLMADADRGRKIAKECEPRWNMAGRVCDVLNELLSSTPRAPSPAVGSTSETSRDHTHIRSISETREAPPGGYSEPLPPDSDISHHNHPFVDESRSPGAPNALAGVLPDWNTLLANAFDGVNWQAFDMQLLGISGMGGDKSLDHGSAQMLHASMPNEVASDVLDHPMTWLGLNMYNEGRYAVEDSN
ncbi:fungal-specific transcription factor domain-containing protein [Auriculariales sp. MPI-PUGE-AT-0066]|nr:fungal-specific transcription factor domain-containing protein [Auriculariales sp. MPI-PUGE-AT-0066]